MSIGVLPSIPDVALIERIGGGAFGDVFSGVYVTDDEFDGQRVAVKCLSQVDSSAIKQFQREAELLADSQDHKYIVSIYEYNLEHEPPYIVMEYCGLGSLRQWAANRKLSWQTVAAMMSHALQGVAWIHDAGGFHRDIKPDNMLVAETAEGSVRVLISDLGLTRIPHPDTVLTKSPWGTEGYTAPEVAAGGEYSPSADVYSLGITFCEMLTRSKDTDKLQSARCPEEFKRLVWAMASTRASQRPTVAEVAGRLKALLEQVKERKRQSKVAGSRRPARRRSGGRRKGGSLDIAPWLIGAGVLLGLGILAAGGESDT